MTTITRTGYQKDNQGSWISKDPSAELIYSMDWSDWLPQGDQLAQVTYALQVRANDPQPLLKLSEGIQTDIYSFVELKGGQVGKIYTVTAHITTVDGLKDSRSFRIKVENRSA